jgi:putative inorganic carbon (hco3(-)) transporter
MALLKNNTFVLILTMTLVALSLIFDHTFLALFVSLVLAVLVLFSPISGIYLLIILIPLRPFLVTVNPGLKIVGDLIIFALLLSTIYKNRQNIKELFRFQAFEIALFLYCLVGVVSALVTGVQLEAIIFQIRAYLLFYFVYYIVKRMKFTEENIRKISWLTFLTAVIISLHGFVEKISDKTLLMPEEWKGWNLTSAATNHIRVYGLLKGPNELALYLLIAFLVSLYLLKKVNGIKRFGIYTGLSIIGATFLLTYSRGAILSLSIFIILHAVFFRAFKKLAIIGLIGVASSLLFLGVNQLADIYQNKILYAQDAQHEQKSSWKKETTSSTGVKNEAIERYTKAFSNDTIQKSSQDGRIFYAKKAMEVFKDHPIIGTGFATFGGAATLSYSSPIYKEYNIGFNFYSDNQYILTLAETGIIGVAILSVFVFQLLYYTIRVYKNGSLANSTLLLFFLITMIVGGLVYNILENDTFMLYYFLALGFLFQRDARLGEEGLSTHLFMAK